MEKVWKCDFCQMTDEEKAIVETHEQDCAFNPKNKTCYTCKNKWNEGYSREGCNKGLRWVEAEDEGNCEGWETKL